MWFQVQEKGTGLDRDWIRPEFLQGSNWGLIGKSSRQVLAVAFPGVR